MPVSRLTWPSLEMMPDSGKICVAADRDVLVAGGIEPGRLINPIGRAVAGAEARLHATQRQTGESGAGIVAVVNNGEPSLLLAIVGPVKEKPSGDELFDWLPVFGVETMERLPPTSPFIVSAEKTVLLSVVSPLETKVMLFDALTVERTSGRRRARRFRLAGRDACRRGDACCPADADANRDADAGAGRLAMRRGIGRRLGLGHVDVVG